MIDRWIIESINETDNKNMYKERKKDKENKEKE